MPGRSDTWWSIPAVGRAFAAIGAALRAMSRCPPCASIWRRPASTLRIQRPWRGWRRRGDAALGGWLNEAGLRLRLVVGLLENLFDPETILIGGALPAALIRRLIEAANPLPASVACRDGRAAPRLMPGGTHRPRDGRPGRRGAAAVQQRHARVGARRAAGAGRLLALTPGPPRSPFRPSDPRPRDCHDHRCRPPRPARRPIPAIVRLWRVLMPLDSVVTNAEHGGPSGRREPAPCSPPCRSAAASMSPMPARPAARADRMRSGPKPEPTWAPSGPARWKAPRRCST